MICGTAAAILLMGAAGPADLVKGEKADARLAKVPFNISFEYVNSREHPRVVGLEGDVKELVKIVEARGGKVLVRTKSVVTALMKRGEDASSLLEEQAVRRFDLGPEINPPITTSAFWRHVLRSAEFSSLPDSQWKTSIQTGSLAKVHDGDAPLKKAYTGRGVLIGVIEPDLPDFRHPDFRNADGTTRFHAIWNLNEEGPGMAGVPYGKVYDPATLNKLLRSGEANRMIFGSMGEHPTNVCSAAAGNGRGSGLYRGVAPDAKLLFVSAPPNNVGVINVAAAIYREADRLGMPCVLSVSMTPDGIIGRAEDGRDLTSTAISELVEEKPGRFYVGPAGNQGQYSKLHWAVNVAEGAEKRAWIYPVAASGQNSFTSSILLEGRNRQSLEVQVSAVNWVDGGYRTGISSEWMRADELVKSGPIRFALTEQVEEAPAGVNVVCAAMWNPEESIVLMLHTTAAKSSKAKAPLLEVKFRGQGKAEFWSEIFAPIVGDSFPIKGATLPDDLGEPDNERSVSSPANGRSTLAAGAYSDAGNEVASYTQPGGAYHDTYKPLVLTAAEVIVANPLDSPMGDETLFDRGRYKRFGGTSCATPTLAGAVALFLEKHPKATVKQFVAAVKAAAFADTHTGQVPSPRCGYGKLDYFRLMQQ